MKWKRCSTNLTGPMSKPIIHVYPTNDDREHELDASGECWCNPGKNPPVFPGAIPVLVHHPLDGRDAVEKELTELLDETKTWDVLRIG